jgi:predicted ABC-type ATPase
LEKLHAAGFASFAGTPDAQLKEFFIEAADEVFAETEALLKAGSSVRSETVLSTSKYRSLAEQIIGGGGALEIIYVALRSPELSARRVNLRVVKGGHAVPPDRLAGRWLRSLKQLPWFLVRAERFLVFDNSEASPVLIAKGGSRTMDWCVAPDAVFPELRDVLCEAFPNLNPS